MTRKSLAVLMIALILISGGAMVFAQDGGPEGDVCSAATIYDSVNAIFAAYQQAASTAQDREGAMAALTTLRGELDKLDALCGGGTGAAATPVPTSTAIPSPTPFAPGLGTRANPYPFGEAGDSGAGFTLRVTGFIRPADRVIRDANVVNPIPPEGREYVIVRVELDCIAGTDGRCEADAIDFELAGDEGVIYQNPFVFYDDELDISVFSGTTATGSLVFLIRDDDANLKLLYKGSMFAPQDVVVYAAEPSIEDGIVIESRVASLNVRSGPGTTFRVAGNLGQGDAAIAFGRNEAGTWLQIAQGWVTANLVTANGDIMALPVTTG